MLINPDSYPERRDSAFEYRVRQHAKQRAVQCSEFIAEASSTSQVLHIILNSNLVIRCKLMYKIYLLMFNFV